MATALAASAAAPLIGKVVSGITSGGAASALGSILGSFSHSKGGGIDVAGNKELMNYQMSLNKQMTQWQNENQYKFMRTGLENAGYNPLLALGATPSTGDVGLATGQGNTASTQIGLNDIISLKNTAANTNLQDQQAETERAKRVNLSADTGLKLAETMYKKGLIKWQDLQNYADLAVKKTSAALNTASAGAQNATSSNIRRQDEWFRKHPIWNNIQYGTGALGNIVGGSFKIGK